MSQDHEQRREMYTAVGIARHKHLFVEGVHALSPSPDFAYRKLGQPSVELLDVNLDSLFLALHRKPRGPPRRCAALFNQTAHSEVPIVDSHLEDAGKFLPDC